eukprot:COSAG05_NODE_24728_length_226_cov_4845.551181_1_plen_63_part_01
MNTCCEKLLKDISLVLYKRNQPINMKNKTTLKYLNSSILMNTQAMNAMPQRLSIYDPRRDRMV